MSCRLIQQLYIYIYIACSSKKKKVGGEMGGGVFLRCSVSIGLAGQRLS